VAKAAALAKPGAWRSCGISVHDFFRLGGKTVNPALMPNWIIEPEKPTQTRCLKAFFAFGILEKEKASVE
jgi:hypothetical protein